MIPEIEDWLNKAVRGYLDLNHKVNRANYQVKTTRRVPNNMRAGGVWMIVLMAAESPQPHTKNFTGQRRFKNGSKSG